MNNLRIFLLLAIGLVAQGANTAPPQNNKLNATTPITKPDVSQIASAQPNDKFSISFEGKLITDYPFENILLMRKADQGADLLITKNKVKAEAAKNITTFFNQLAKNSNIEINSTYVNEVVLEFQAGVNSTRTIDELFARYNGLALKNFLARKASFLLSQNYSDFKMSVQNELSLLKTELNKRTEIGSTSTNNLNKKSFMISAPAGIYDVFAISALLISVSILIFIYKQY